MLTKKEKLDPIAMLIYTQNEILDIIKVQQQAIEQLQSIAKTYLDSEIQKLKKEIEGA